MRCEEMPTISRAQKHDELMQSQEWHLNSDGTTLQQQKKVALLVNGIVLGVRDVNDGSAHCAFEALNAELSKVDSTTSDFNIEHIVSSTSDAAATQTKFTHLLEKEIGREVVTNKCSMHLGVNLRAAQVKAASSVDFDSVSRAHSECSNSENDTSDDEYDDSDADPDSDSVVVNRDIDLFVHETAKLFGHLGTPEYAHGACSFRIFLVRKAEESTGEEKAYYESAQKVTLERQIGSRYYVTSRNAGRIHFLCRAMIAFLHERQLVKSLNRLESTCLLKLRDPIIIATLKLEGLMFDKVYADLMTLVKSTELNKSSLDMIIHYEELLAHLESLSVNPESILDPEVSIFKSEKSLYSDASKLNHRLTKVYAPVREKLYESHESDESILFPLVLAVGTAMHSKLESYMKDYLPGGKYYDPDPDVKAVLSKLQPHNDRTESVFGANDWLCRLLPNMAQSTRSTMLEFSYNKTMDWLKLQGEEREQALVSLAQQRRKDVVLEIREEAESLHKAKLEGQRREVRKAQEREKVRLDKLDSIKDETLVSSIDQLNQRVTEIHRLSIPMVLKDAEVKKLVQRQVLLRTTVFQQKGVKIPLSSKGKSREVSELLDDLEKIIREIPVRVRRKQNIEQSHQQLFTIFEKPSLLKGVKIRHRFQDDGVLRWYEGTITSIKRTMFNIHYHETDEECDFLLTDIKEDFFGGDLYIV